jgi:nucleoside-diphosphate-sugar epimerase
MLANEKEIDLTDGFQRRNFLYVEDAVEIYRTIAENIHAITTSFTSFNAGTGESVTIRDFVLKIHSITGSASRLNFGAVKYRENEIMNPDSDISGILQLGWKPVISLDEGLTRTIDYERGLA